MKNKGPQTFPMGKFPTGLQEGKGVRPFDPFVVKGNGPQVFPHDQKLGTGGPTDKQRGYNPTPVTGKGPQTFKEIRLGDMSNQNQDPSRPYNPK